MMENSSITSFFKRSDSNQHDAQNPATPKPKGADTHPPTSSFSSLSGSQRIVRNGETLITGSDGEETDSTTSSLESPDELLRRFRSPLSDNFLNDINQKSPNIPIREKSMAPKRNAVPSYKTKQRKAPPAKLPPKFAFSLDDLVNDAEKDVAQEAKVTHAKTTLKKPKAAENVNSSGNTGIRDDILASMVSDGQDASNMQRLKSAVSRTEMLDQEIRWSFFEEMKHSIPVPKFPHKAIPAGSWEEVLCEPDSRDRTFLSGIVGEAFHGSCLTDCVLLWICNSLVTEPRPELRFAYCSALKVAPAERISSFFQASTIDQMFQRLGAKSDSLATAKPIQPILSEGQPISPVNNEWLVSVLGLIRALANNLNTDTREHALKLLLRLSVDNAVMSDGAVCIETQRAIVSILGESEGVLPDITIYGVMMEVYNTITDVALRSQLLKNLLLTTPDMAALKYRLANAFLFEDPSSLDGALEHVINLKRISTYLKKSKYFRVNRRAHSEELFNFSLLLSFTSILDAAIGSGIAWGPFTDRTAEIEFNREVDELADRIKSIFTSIQDTGASHLKRTEAKEDLQALHYRLIYGVRTKPRPRKSLFTTQKDETIKKYIPKKTDEEQPIKK